MSNFDPEHITRLIQQANNVYKNIDKINGAMTNPAIFDINKINRDVSSALTFIKSPSFNLKEITQSLNQYANVANVIATKHTILINKMPSIISNFNKAINDISVGTVISQPIVSRLNISSDEYIKSHPQFNEAKNELNKTMIDIYAPPIYKENLSTKISNFIFFASYTIDAEYIKFYVPFIREQILGFYINQELDARLDSGAVSLISLLISFAKYNNDNRE